MKAPPEKRKIQDKAGGIESEKDSQLRCAETTGTTKITWGHTHELLSFHFHSDWSHLCTLIAAINTWRGLAASRTGETGRRNTFGSYFNDNDKNGKHSVKSTAEWTSGTVLRLEPKATAGSLFTKWPNWAESSRRTVVPKAAFGGTIPIMHFSFF